MVRTLLWMAGVVFYRNKLYYIKLFARNIINPVSWIVANLIPKQKNLILLTGSTHSRYNESSRYLYEYILLNYSSLQPIWMTDSKTVYAFLLEKKMPVVYHRSIKGAFCYLRAGVVIGTGSIYPKLYEFVGKKTIKICLWHGVGPRSTNAVDNEVNDNPLVKSALHNLKKLHLFDVFNFTSEFTATTIGKLQFIIPKNKRFILGYPRCDHLMQKEKMDSRLDEKKFFSSMFPKINPKSKTILYSPTWRANDRKQSLPVNLLSGFNLIKFDQWLTENNLYLLISVHPLVEHEACIRDCHRIKYISDDPLLDINQVLPEIDLLLTDYSSIATDFILLDRPVIYIMPDYDFFLLEYGMIEDMRLSLPGYEVKSADELESKILDSIVNPSEKSSNRTKYLERYYDTSNINSCEKCCEIIKMKIDKGFK